VSRAQWLKRCRSVGWRASAAGGYVAQGVSWTSRFPALLCRALWYEATLGPLVLRGQARRLATRESDPLARAMASSVERLKTDGEAAHVLATGASIS